MSDLAGGGQLIRGERVVARFALAKVIYVDVDGTLHRKGRPSATIVKQLHQWKAEGFELILWSARGKDWARKVAESLEIAGLFSAVLTKPGYILDDKGWDWIKNTKVLQARLVAHGGR